MALRINLYHEVLRNRKQAQYDPLKLSMIGLALVAAGLIAWYFVELQTTKSAESSYRSKQAEYAKLQVQEKQAKAKEEEYTKQIAVVEKLGKRIEERFYWAPLLEELALSVSPTVQTAKVTGDVSGEGLRKVQVAIEGIAAGVEPRGAAEEFRTALAERLGKKYKNVVASFKNLEDSNESATLNGETLKTAAFNISVTFNIGTEPPPPPPKPSKRKAVAQQNQ